MGQRMKSGKRISVGVGRVLKLQQMRAAQRKTRIAMDGENKQASKHGFLGHALESQAYLAFIARAR